MMLENGIVMRAEAFDHSDLAYCVIRVILNDEGKPCDWEFVYLNDALARIEGIEKEKLLHQRFFEVFPKADPKWFAYYYPAAYEGKSFTVKEISEEIGVYLRIHCFPVAHGYCGCVLEDIHELEESLRREHEGDMLIRGLAKNYASVWLVRAPEMSMQLYQKAGEQALKEQIERLLADQPYAEGLPEYIRRYVHQQDQARVLRETALDTVAKAIRSQGMYTVHYRRVVDGRKEHYDYYQMDFAASEASDSFVMAFRNVSSVVQEQQKQEAALQDALQAARQANAAKTTFLSNMSHDIRTPMNAIMGFTTLAMKHIAQPEMVKDYLEKIETSGKHLLSLINDVLDMSRIESGKMRLEETECNLADILRDLRSILLPDLRNKRLSFCIDTVDVYDENVICDTLRLNQVLLNVAGNAMKFTPAGGQISIRLIERPCADPQWADYEFHVQDTGVGMSREFMQRLFEPFERERSSTVSGVQGTGLGMSITKRIVDMMNGTIGVTSQQNMGTEIVIRLPLRKSGAPVPQPELKEVRNMHALVVDDDFNTCDSVSGMLGQLGMRADWCMSGREAVLRSQQAARRSDPYGVYLIDWLIPDMNGVEVARSIRREVGSETPIIILSAYDWGEIAEEARAAGVTGFVSKPLFISDIRQCLQQILHASEQQAEEAPQPTPTEGRLLLAEDNELNREIAVALLTDAGFRVDTAENGQAAVDQLQRMGPGYYDLVLMDIQMPVLDGYAAARVIRSWADPALSSIPIIAMTADAFQSDKQKTREAGMNAHLSKPILMDEVVRTIRDIIG